MLHSFTRGGKTVGQIQRVSTNTASGSRWLRSCQLDSNACCVVTQVEADGAINGTVTQKRQTHASTHSKPSISYIGHIGPSPPSHNGALADMTAIGERRGLAQHSTVIGVPEAHIRHGRLVEQSNSGFPRCMLGSGQRRE